MELQWPLILFTTLLAWSAGVFASQSVLALKGRAAKAQIPSLVVAFVLMVVGGIAVFFHLQHWERIFNGFGHITSGITQELIVVVLLFVMMVVYFLLARKNDGKVPAWAAVVAIVLSVALTIVMAHSYMMAARPAWNSIAWPLYVLGNACALGPATVAVVCNVVKESEDGSSLALINVIGSVANAVFSAFYAVVLSMASSGFASVEWYFDPTEPNARLFDAASVTPLAPDSAALFIVGALIVGAVAPIVCALMGKKQGKWNVWGAAIVVCSLVGAICMRVVFYQMGASVFTLY